MALHLQERNSFDRRRPFSRADARAVGLPLAEVVGARFHKVFYDCYVASTVALTTRLRSEAALGVSAPGSFISHHTAAELWGGAAPATSDTHVTVPNRAVRSTRSGLKSHVAGEGSQTAILRGLRIGTPEQTFIDLASILDLVQLVVLGDSLIKTCGLTPKAFADASAAWPGRGAKRARRAARYLRPGVDSPPESRLRLLFVLAGLPEPLVNVIIREVDGSWRRRFDLCFPSFKLIIEYDGRHHLQDSRQWRFDLRRREELDALGWRIIVITSDDLNRQPGLVLCRVRDALIDRGANGIRRQFKTEWMRYFPGS